MENTTNSAPTLGSKIRHFRMMKDMTIKQLAEKVHITSSMLSQLEHDKTTPSLNTLRSIAVALDVAMFRFFVEDEPDTANIIHPHQRRQIIDNGVNYELLTSGLNGDIEFCQMTVKEGCSTYTSQSNHKGEEVALIVKGSFDLSLDGVTHRLQEGDSVYIAPMSRHFWINAGDGDAVLIFAVTPPNF